MMKATFCCLLIALIFSSLPVYAEETLPLAEQVGKWTFSMNDSGTDLKKVSSADRARFRKELQSIAATITATPAMKHPKGFEARFWGSIAGSDRYDIRFGKSAPPPRTNGVLALMIGQYEEKNGKKRAAFNSPATMDISVNTLGHVFSHLPVIYKDKEGFLLPEPQRDGERRGMTAYLNNGHAVAVLTRVNKPLWYPVSRERYLSAAIEATGKGLGLPSATVVKGKKKKKATATELQSGKPILVEESKTWIDPVNGTELVEQSRSLADEIKESSDTLNARLKQLQAELDALTPGQRAMQARVEIKRSEDGTAITLLPPDNNGGVAVVTPDFGFFNKKLPVETAQLIVVQWKFDGTPVFDPEQTGITDNLHNRTLLDIYRNLDWQKLVGNVSRTGP